MNAFDMAKDFEALNNLLNKYRNLTVVSNGIPNGSVSPALAKRSSSLPSKGKKISCQRI